MAEAMQTPSIPLDSTNQIAQILALSLNLSALDVNQSDLSALINCDNLDLDGLKALTERAKEEMRRKEILSQYKIYQFKSGMYEGQWFAKKNGKKVHQAKTRKELEDNIVACYNGMIPNSKTTFKAIFEACQDDRIKRIKDPGSLASAKATKKNHERNYRRFIQGTFLENKQIAEITKHDIAKILDLNLERYELKKQAFKNLKTILNQTLNYGIKLDLILMNPMLQVYWDDYKNCFAPSTPIQERGYTMEEMQAMYEITRQNQEVEPEDARHWSYEFNLLTATRRAEIPPLRWSDVHLEEGYIDIHQEEIGEEPYIIKDETKTAIDRYFPITEIVLEFLIRLKENNDKYHPGSEFLFPDEKQVLGCITPQVTYRAHTKICKQLGIELSKEIPRGTHAFRRVHQTAFIEEGGSIELASKVYGNSPKVVEQHYLLNLNAKSSASIVDMTQRKLTEQLVHC